MPLRYTNPPATKRRIPRPLPVAARLPAARRRGQRQRRRQREWLARDFEGDWYPKHWPSMTVAEDGGVLLGLVQPAGDEINGLWVDPAAQGRGVGTALLERARAWAVEHGYHAMTLTTFRDVAWNGPMV